MATEAASRDVQRLESERDWHGFLTTENAEAVAARLRRLLGGRRYTFVSANEGLRDYFPEVRTGQRLRDDGASAYTYGDGGRCAGVSVQDTYGSWGVHSDAADQSGAHRRVHDASGRGTVDKNLAYLHFKHDRVEVEHFAPAGFRLYWLAVIEWPEDEQ